MRAQQSTSFNRKIDENSAKIISNKNSTEVQLNLLAQMKTSCKINWKRAKNSAKCLWMKKGSRTEESRTETKFPILNYKKYPKKYLDG